MTGMSPGAMLGRAPPPMMNLYTHRHSRKRPVFYQLSPYIQVHMGKSIRNFKNILSQKLSLSQDSECTPFYVLLCNKMLAVSKPSQPRQKGLARVVHTELQEEDVYKDMEFSLTYQNDKITRRIETLQHRYSQGL